MSRLWNRLMGLPPPKRVTLGGGLEELKLDVRK